MDHEILVSEFRKILSIFKQEQTHIALWMLKALEADMSTWNLMVSASEYNHISTKKAVQHVVNILNNNLNKSILKKIVRVTILKTSDPFVKDINQTFHVRNTVKYIQSSFIGGVYIEKAIIFESHPVVSPDKQKKSSKEIVSVG